MSGWSTISFALSEYYPALNSFSHKSSFNKPPGVLYPGLLIIQSFRILCRTSKFSRSSPMTILYVHTHPREPGLFLNSYSGNVHPSQLLYSPLLPQALVVCSRFSLFLLQSHVLSVARPLSAFSTAGRLGTSPSPSPHSVDPNKGDHPPKTRGKS